MKKMLTLTAVLAAACLTTSVKANSILGIDVSTYQGTITWSSVAGDGVKFAAARATMGTASTDGQYRNNITHGKTAGVQMTAYHFSYPDESCPSVQVNHHWASVGGDMKADGKTLYPMVDFEEFTGHPCESSYTAWFNDWSTDIKAKTSLFMHPVIYGSAGSGMCDLTTACTLSDWVANYNGENLYTGNPWSCCTSCNYVSPGTKNGWTYWQVSSTGAISGISGNVDLDAYPLSLAELKDYQGF